MHLDIDGTGGAFMTSLWQFKRFEARISLFKSLDCPLTLAAAGKNQRFTRYPPVINHNRGWCNYTCHLLLHLTSSQTIHVYLNIYGLVQERRNSIANALDLRLSCTNPSIYMIFIFTFSFLIVVPLYQIIISRFYVEYKMCTNDAQIDQWPLKSRGWQSFSSLYHIIF